MGIWRGRKVDLDLCACKISCPFASIYISSAGWRLPLH
ncbi:hypothetical protein BAE44_0005810 [Dichanthelium oligosanthes]|uniref:Uncharacterized protein n=1 Tax=Dichanthelium oligosanthes TaxID=888268 RepID=A0A1E5W711_9POAL|nr:hypothetical protein BAE44_0005810 [Dichanthelium oligosanthes]